MSESKKIPLAERMNSVTVNKANMPRAMGMCLPDFFGVMGEMTGRQERYLIAYQTHIAPHAGPEDRPKRVCELAVEAEKIAAEKRASVLFWLLVEPFEALNEMEGGKTP